MVLVILILVVLSLFLTKRIKVNSLTIALLLYAFSNYLLELNIIDITEINIYTKSYILIAYLMLLVGAVIGTNLIYRKSTPSSLDLKIEKKIFFYSIIIAIIAISLNSFYYIKSSNGILEFFIRYNELYADRIDGDQSVMIPYLNSIIYISASTGGVVLGSDKKESKIVYGVIPILLITVDSIINFGRANLLIGIIIFGIAYYYTLYRKNNFQLKLKLKSLLKVLLLFSILLLTMVQIRSFRGGFENYHIDSNNIIIEKLIDWGLLTPSLIVYFAGPPSVLNQTFGSDLMKSNDVLLENTFAPISRIYAPFFDQSVRRYEEFVNIGIRYSNTGTMLKDFLLDFGVIGSLFFTLLLGALYGVSYKLYIITGNLHLYSFLSAYLIMGAFVNLFRSGQFLLPFFLMIIILILPKLKWIQP